MQHHFHYEKDAEGIITLTMDWPGQQVNTLDRQFVPALAAALEQIEAEREQVAGVILASAKQTFFAGADLKWLIALGPADAPAIFAEVEQIDLFEVNEAFAAVVMHFQRETGVPWEKINVNGGSIALGHPLGATGAMLIGTLLDDLERRQLRYGLATLCVGGGMGIATIIERV